MSVENGRGMIRGTCEELAELPLAGISHLFLLNGSNQLNNRRIWVSANDRLSFRWCSAETSKGQARDAFLGEKGQVLRKALRYPPCISQRQLTLERLASRIARCRFARWRDIRARTGDSMNTWD